MDGLGKFIAAFRVPSILLVAVITINGCQPKRSNPLAKHAEGDHDMISLNIKCERSDQIPGGDVGLEVQIVNGGTNAIEMVDPQDSTNGQLEYMISGPGLPEGVWVSRRSTSTNAAAEPVPPISVAAGGSFETRVSLNPMADLSELGEYEVHVRLAHAGEKPVVSNAARFRLGAIRPTAVQIGLGVSDNWGEGEGAFVNHGELHTFEFRESAPEIAEADVDEIVHRASVGNVTDVGIPTRNTAFLDELVRWVVWLDGSTVKALNSLETAPASVALTQEPVRLIQPVLKTKGSHVEVLTLGKDGRSITLSQFARVPASSPEFPLEAKGTIQWTAPLPVVPGEITVALEAPARGDGRHVMLAADTFDGIAIYSAQYGAAGLTSAFLRTTIRASKGVISGGSPRVSKDSDGGYSVLFDSDAHGGVPHLIRGATPGLFVDANGDTWLSVLAAVGDGVVWFEVRFIHGKEQQPEIVVTDLKPLRKGAEVTAAGVFYVGNPSTWGILRRDVVLLVNEQQLVRWDGGKLAPAYLHGKLVRPLRLVPGETRSYLLYMDELRGPHLEALE